MTEAVKYAPVCKVPALKSVSPPVFKECGERGVALVSMHDKANVVCANHLKPYRGETAVPALRDMAIVQMLD